jgi:hypothetical protein
MEENKSQDTQCHQHQLIKHSWQTNQRGRGPDERLVIPDNNAIVLYSRCDGEMHIARYKLQDVMGRCI